YPFFHIRNGRELSGYQVWPLWGYEEKGITTRTNDFDQEITVGGHKKYFALWPLFFDHKTGIGTETPKKKQALLPLYSYERSPARDSTTVLWPLFTWTHDRARGYREWDAPWPFVVFARGEGKTANRVWPFYSHVETTNKESSFFLWPLYTSRKIHAEPLERTRNRVCFFLYSDIRETNTDTGRAKRRTDLWPVFSAKKSADGRERIQIGALLEPLIPGNSSIEKNFSPLWSLWVSEKNPETGKSRESLLWNLYQHQEAEDTEEWSFLFGLFKYKSGNSGNRLRLFYIPLGGNETPVDSD
ncbi:MAG: hypothetical protein K9N48_09085, partial [Verrucomicrobia bacterium]|nr:hypothetical protein [Verrucomicrobiota bacterium]